MAQMLNDYDSVLDLSVPDNGVLRAILVDIDLAPKDGSCTIYGIMPDGHTEGVTVQGGHSQIRLPFAKRKIYVKHNGKLDHIRIGAIGHL